MRNSSNLITLKDMAQCLSESRTLTRDGLLDAETYLQLCDNAVKRCEEILEFAIGLGWELCEEDGQEIDTILDHCEVAKAYRCSVCFPGGDYDLYCSLQTLGSLPSVEIEVLELGEIFDARCIGELNFWNLRDYDWDAA